MTVNDPTAHDPLAQNISRARNSRLASVVAISVWEKLSIPAD